MQDFCFKDYNSDTLVETMWEEVSEISTQKGDMDLKYKFSHDHPKDVILIHDN